MRSSALVACVVAVAARATLPAATYTWTGGAGNGLFSTPGNWQDGAVPSLSETNEEIAFPLAAAATVVNDLGNIAVTRISFTGAFAATIQSPAGYKFTEVETIVNGDSAHHVFLCPVVCKDGVTPAITRLADNYIAFDGGLTMHAMPIAYGEGAVWSGRLVVTGAVAHSWGAYNKSRKVDANLLAGTIDLLAADANLDRLGIYPGATVTVQRAVYNGCSSRNGSKSNGWGYFALVFDNGNGVLRIRDELRATGDAVLFHSYADEDHTGGTIIVRKVICGQTARPAGNFTYPNIFLNCGASTYNNLAEGGWNGEGVWVIGSGGLAFDPAAIADATYGAHQRNKAILADVPSATLYAYEDWALQPHPTGVSSNALSIYHHYIVIDTGHYAVGDAELDGATSHVVTLAGKVTGAGELRIRGGGSVVFANAYTDFSGGLVANGAVTAAVNAGCAPGAGAVTLNDAATLKVAQSGTVTLGGALTLGADATLAFNWTDAARPPVLALASDEAFHGDDYIPATMKVKVTAADGVRPPPGVSHVLTTGGAFVNNGVKRAVNLVSAPDWVESVSVNDGGDLVLKCRRGLVISIK